jgi:hypothetical protein
MHGRLVSGVGTHLERACDMHTKMAPWAMRASPKAPGVYHSLS